MQITDEQKEKAAYVNLPQFLISHGFDLKRVGKEYVWKAHDSLHIKDNAPNERGVWHQFSTGAGGDNIGFLREFMGMTFIEAVEALTSEHIERIDMPSHIYQTGPIPQTLGEFSLAEANNVRRAFAFLCRTRGLDYSLVASLVRQGVISQEEKTGNVLFKFYDAHGKVIGAEKVGTSTEHKFKGVAAGSAGGHGFEVVRGAGEKAYFFESAIDMLSYLQMHDKELTNCRLVSMMGVKPNIVLDTMLRHNIPSENLFLCSDNDTAGNDFVQRLQAKYPDMKRIITPDIYKDWNDMLRGIPKVVEQESGKIKEEHNMADLITYGNRMWNDATDNRDKSLISMQLSDFQRVQDTLESAGINYYAYEMNGTVRMAVNDKDSDWLRSILGNVSITKSNRTYSPPEKNVFGSTEYRYIPQKEYFSADRDLVLKMAEIMAQRGMQFSGRIYPTGKGTLTVSHADLFSVRNIRDEVVNMRRQFARHDMGEKVGNRDHRTSRDTHYYMSRLTPEQFHEVNPLIETSVNYHAIARNGKVAFAVDKENAPAFHRALENAVRENNMLHSMADIGLTMEQNVALSPVIHRLAVENMSLELTDFFDARYDDAQFGEMISLVNAYLDQPVYERYGEHSKLSEMLDAKNSFDRSIELSDFFTQHEFSDEQKSAITAMFVGDVTRAQIDVIDDTFSPDEIQQYGEILHNSLDENAAAEFLENRNKPELTEMEKAFLESPIEPVMAKSVLAWDEIEDLGYIFFEDGYTDKYPASDRAMYGNGVYEKDIYEIADRMRQGENIHADLTRALLGNQQTFTTKNDHTFHITYNKDDMTATFGNAERSISYDAVGEAFLALFENEYKDILKAREEEQLSESETTKEEKQDFVAFSWGKDPEWFTESEILHDFAQQHPTISFAFANAVFEYLDEKQHTERANPDLNAGWYKKTDFVISGVQNGEDFNYEGRFDIGDGKGTGGGSIIDHIRQFQDGIINSDRYPFDNNERKAAAQEAMDSFIPFLEAHSQLTAEEIQILADFKAEHPIRTEVEMEMAHGTFRIMQFPPAQDENDSYHGIRFFSREFNAEHGVQLNHSDYIQVYEGDLSEYPADRILESIYERMNVGEKPDGYTGHSLSVSDVIITNIDGVETAYYCNDFGFEEMPEYFREKEILPEIYQLVTNGGLDGGIDHKKEYSSVEEAMNAGYKYMSERYLGFCVVNTETQSIERTIGDFPYEKAFSPEFLKDNGLWGAAHDAEQLMEEQDKPVTLRDVVDRYFGTDCESAETVDGEWKLQIYDGTSENLMDKNIVGVLYHNSEPVVDIHNDKGDFTISARTHDAENIANDIADMMKDRRPDQNFTVTVPESQIIADFKAKTNEMFHAVDGYTPHEIENVVKSFVFTTFYENGITADIGGIAVTGSRSRGIESEKSDIDVVVEINGSDLKEDTLFNILHEEGMDIGGINVDINPIRPEETGTLESYLPTAEAYLSEKMKESVQQEAEQDAMVHISEEQALAYFDNDRFAVYLIYDDGTEGQAQTRDEIISHTGELGIEKAEWDKFMSQLDTAKSLINEFCEKEFGTKADFSNLAKVDIAYSTDEETGIEVQSYADLENFRIVKEYDGKPVSTQQYDSLESMCNGALQNLEFGDLVYLSAEEKGLENAEQEPEKETVSIEEAVENDAPLFADADVIEQIREDEKADVPFWQTPILEGDQLSLFGDDEPVAMKPERKSAERSTKSTHTAEELEYLKAELMRGTGFEDGKFRMLEFVEQNHPSTRELAQKLKNEYGIGGHSGSGDVSFADHDSKGITIEFVNHTKLDFSWNEAAKMLNDLISKGEYITDKDIQERIRHAEYVIENTDPNTADEYDRRRFEKAEQILAQYEKAEPEKPVQEAVIDEAPITEPEKHDTIEVGDRFRNVRTGEISEVISLTGAVPWQTDQCTVQRESGSFAITENVDFAKLFDKSHYEYIGNSTKTTEIEAEKPEISPVTETPVTDTAEIVSTEQPEKADNFVITDDALGEGGAKTKFRANVKAIKTLKTLEREKRPATAEEKETLSKYVGWGALAKAFDKSDEKWAAEFKELSELLTPEEYRQARATVNDAFFTSPTIIDGIYEALGNFGFDGGTVLEPAMGIGNFFGRMPEDMQANSQLYGVEIDDLSGRIAKALYPDADIAIKGFEQNRFQNGCFDVAVGNVPFGELGFKDTSHGATKLHDYFFLEALDKLKNGGIMAFVTSAGTLDKRDESTRQMLADKADFIGAIRLPGGKNGAFKDNAGTEVTTDIIFLQKHEGKSVAEMSEIPDWVHIGETADGLSINQYFADNPDMVLGTVVEGNKLYGSGTMVVAEDGFDLKSAVHDAISKLSAEFSHERGRDVYAKTADGVQVQIPSNLRNYSFFLSDDQVFFKKNNAACEFRFDKGTAQHKRFTAFIELRDLTRELIEAMELDKPDSVIKDLQEKLNVAYDDFYKKYGLIHSQTNKRYFSEDVSYNLVAGLEKSYDKTKLIAKSDIFTKRTIMPPKAVEHVDTALEALTLSIAEKARVDFEYMGKLTGMTEDELKHDLTGEIFRIPHTENSYQTASEYLSGDIRQKLKAAEEIAEYDADFNINVSALKQAMPEALKAGDIDVKLGAAWIEPKYYEQFIYELLQTPAYQRSDSPMARWNKSAVIDVEYSVHANSFHVSNKSSDRSVLATQKYGSHKMNAYDIFEHLLNLQEPKIYKTVEVPDGMGDTKEKRVVDIDATRVVQNKAESIRKAFKAWIFKDPARREAIVERYNELFNSIRPREYDGSALSFPMMTADIQLHDHQKNAIAHAMFGGNTLFAHCVGAGKTFEMIATAMESKRLGLCTKSLFAVPNHLTEQIGDDFQKLYPGANILVATKKDFQKANRQQLFAKIATGNYDAVIIGHSQLGKIPVSKERQVMTIQGQIDDILRGIEELKKSEGSKFQIKAMERTRKSLQKQLDKLQKSGQDDTLTFEQLGIDRLFIDEAHEFKNLFVATKLQNIAGISNSASQKALDLFLKCRYLDEKTGGKGVIFATGTPLSNSITELHTMMRYLEYDFLSDHGLQHFDNWVAVFGEQKTDWELKPAGNGFKERTRIANYTGLPELMSMFKQVADIRTADTLKLDVPDCDYQVVQVEATPFQQELVQELADRAEAINSGNVDPTIDNMLRITSDGRKLGLDPRLIDPSFEDNPDTKLNRCVENVARIHAETVEDRLTQIIFCDLGVPHKASETVVEGEDADEEKDNRSIAEVESLEEECDFCVYDDIRDKLIARGIPAEEIAYIHDAKTEQQKADLFDKVRNGDIRILIGSTSKMGTGTNVQKKLVAVHDLDIPWRPADMDQRAGRIIRQGNDNKNVQIFRYVTKGTFDSYSYQTLEAKQRFIGQIMTSKEPVRKCEDIDQQALTYSEIKALCTGDERIKEKLMLENAVKELRVLAAEHRNTVFEMEDRIGRFPEQEQRLVSILENLRIDREALRKLPIDSERKLPVFKITIGETEYTDRKEAAKAFEDAVLAIKFADTPVKIGSFQGFELSVTINSNMMGGGTTACLLGAASHTTKLIESFAHNLNRLESALYNIDGKIERTKADLAKLRLDHEEAKKIVAEPFPQQSELESKEERLKVLTDALNQAAIEAKKNAPKREKTCYFERAKIKKEAMRVARQKSKPTDKSKNKNHGLE